MDDAKWVHDNMSRSVYDEVDEPPCEWHLLPERHAPDWHDGCRACVYEYKNTMGMSSLVMRGVSFGDFDSAEEAMKMAENVFMVIVPLLRRRP